MRAQKTQDQQAHVNPTALGTAKTLWDFGCSECNRVKNQMMQLTDIHVLPS